MAFRFQRRLKVAPGIRLNVSKGGVGLSAGPRGASVSMGRRGVYGNMGVPGTGLSFRENLNKGQKNNTTRNKVSPGGQVNLQISIDDDGQVTLLYPSGECSGQLIPDSILSFSSAATGDMPPLNECGRCWL
ncbi:DUF4236 domain-containing protein [Marinobacter sp. CA1]|uniref:DUF4236 domain-containing protein n=1 Tax=Marinobacter sp. CA1 TaxID=2817656 RepID=UPI001D0708F0|nr:DUF4236 domain-containing protein [Marinobacter sp. CA1]